MKRNRKMILTLTLSLLFLFTCSLLTFFATEADNGSVAIQEGQSSPTPAVANNVSWVPLVRHTDASSELFRPYTWPYATHTYFNDFVTSPCRCHDAGNCVVNGNCDCTTPAIGWNYIQCCGYAHLVFHTLTGHYPTESAYVKNIGNHFFKEDMSASLVQRLSSEKIPIFLKLTHDDGEHYICVVGFNENGLYYCDANGFVPIVDHCLVENGIFISYQKFAETYNSFLVGVTPINCHFDYYPNGNNHIYGCSGCTKDQIIENHNMVGSLCTDCGAINVHRAHETSWTVNPTHHWTRCITCNDLQITDTQQHTFVNHRCSVCGMMDALINKVPGDTEVN